MHRSYEPRFLQIAHSLGFLFRLCEAGVNSLIAVKSEKLTVEGQTLRHFLGSFKPQPQQGNQPAFHAFRAHFRCTPPVLPLLPWALVLKSVQLAPGGGVSQLVATHPGSVCLCSSVCSDMGVRIFLLAQPHPTLPAPTAAR